MRGCIFPAVCTYCAEDTANAEPAEVATEPWEIGVHNRTPQNIGRHFLLVYQKKNRHRSTSLPCTADACYVLFFKV